MGDRHERARLVVARSVKGGSGSLSQGYISFLYLYRRYLWTQRDARRTRFFRFRRRPFPVKDIRDPDFF
jgi:hypothetical protein